MERVTLGVEEAPPDEPMVQPEEVETQTEDQQPETEPEATDRPDWLPDKFQSPEDMAKAYSSLEKKQSQQAAKAEGLLTTDEFDKYNDEYNDKGSLSDDAYQALEKKGLSRELIDTYIKGQNAINEASVGELLNIVGGQETYDQMTEWARENLAEDELDAYNDAVQDSDLGAAKLAIRGLYSQFSSVNGVGTPQLVQGGKTPSVGGYGSTAEMTSDMKDPRYKAGDKNFHAHVEKRLAMTSPEVM